MPIRSLGPFELEEQIGSGAMGVVYRAKYVVTGQRVAVKLLAPQLAENEKVIARFKRELEILKKLKHPHIVQCYGGGRLGTQRFYAMELVEGGSLAETLQKQGKLPWARVVEYGRQVCAALQHAHENGVVHRDLKPANLMLDKAGNIKLADFGLARLSEAEALTAAGKTMGTFAYMAPEQITGKSPITPRTDLYALGIVLYELLTGKTPFQARTIVEMLTQHLNKVPPRVCVEGLECPAWLERAIFLLLEKDPEKRPRDAQAVARTLDAGDQALTTDTALPKSTPTLTNASASAPPSMHIDVDTTLNRTSRPGKRKHNLSWVGKRTWLVATAVAVLTGALVWTMWPREQPAPKRAAPAAESVREPESK